MGKGIKAEIKGLGKIMYTPNTEDLFKELKRTGAENIISARDLAYARVNSMRIDSLNVRGFRVSEGIIYIPREKHVTKKKEILLVRKSPLMNEEVFRFDENDGGIECQVEPHKYLKKSEQDAVEYIQDREILKLNWKKTHNYKIPTNRFGEEELTMWLFQDQAKIYGEFLGETIKKMRVRLPFFESDYGIKLCNVEQIFIHGLGKKSYISATQDFEYTSGQENDIWVETSEDKRRINKGRNENGK
jgi:hypothetical protein